MFGISFAEFLVILVVAIFIIGPKDMPEVARYIIKMIYKIKKFIDDTRKELKQVGNELGLEEIKSEVERELVSEKIKFEKEVTTIIDIYGNEHHVHEIEKLRPDVTKEELESEISYYNLSNQKSLSDNSTTT